MQLLTDASIFFVGLVIGGIVWWFVGRSSARTQIDAEVRNAKSTMEVEQTLGQERLRTTAQALALLDSEHTRLQSHANTLQSDLDQARIEQARLTERVAQIPSLDTEVARLTGLLGTFNEQIRLLSVSDAQNAESLKNALEQIQEWRTNSTELEVQLTTKTEALQAATKRNAALEEQSSRIPSLDREIHELKEQVSTLELNLANLRESSGTINGALTAELEAERRVVSGLRGDLATAQSELTGATTKVALLTDQLTELRTRTEAEQQSADRQLQLLIQAKKELSDQFENLANKIFDEKSTRFAEQNQTSLSQLLDPLRSKLTEFQGKVEEVYVNEGKDRSALATQVQQLLQLNNTLSQDAKNLTLALKGSAKTQGNWGELILERVLEASGLRKDHEYRVQDSHTREDGTRAQPDVIIDLPEERKLIVDSKVSLVAYERYVHADTDEARVVAMRQHLDSVRGHIKSLSEKGYEALYGFKSLDFVLAFVPIEPAFMVAVTNDSDLFMDAWHRNVLLVSPSTLLFVVRTVAHLWRQEAQSKNAQDIARRGAELYDKLVGFVGDLDAVGTKLEQAQNSYKMAHSKLATGRGNVIRQAEMLRHMGVKPSKSLPAALIDNATPSDDSLTVNTSSTQTATQLAGEPADLSRNNPSDHPTYDVV